MARKETKIFISYDKEDQKVAQILYDRLKGAGMSPWMDTMDIRPGEALERVTIQAIRDSAFFLALFSSKSTSRDGYNKRELIHALEIHDEFKLTDIYLIPVRIDNCEIPEGKLRELQSVDLFPSFEKGFEHLISAIIPPKLDKETIASNIESFVNYVAITSSKGGTGKSIITASLGYVLAHCGFKTLLVDLDLFTHGLSFYLLSANVRKPQKSIWDALMNSSPEPKIDQLQIPGKFLKGNLFLIPSISRNDSPKSELTIETKYNSLHSFTERIREVIPFLDYDFVLLDTRGGTDHTSIGAAQAAESFIIVTEADKPSWDMGGLFVKTIQEEDSKQETYRAGFIINKNVLPSSAIEDFLRRQWECPHLATIPLDENAIRCFQEDKVPVAEELGCKFSAIILQLVRERFVSPAWSPESLSRLKVLEQQSQTILDTAIQVKATEIRSERFSSLMRIYGTLIATGLLTVPVIAELTDKDFKLGTSFIFIAAILVFFMTITDTKLVRFYIREILRLFGK